MLYINISVGLTSPASFDVLKQEIAWEFIEKLTIWIDILDRLHADKPRCIKVNEIYMNVTRKRIAC